MFYFKCFEAGLNIKWNIQLFIFLVISCYFLVILDFNFDIKLSSLDKILVLKYLE